MQYEVSRNMWHHVRQHVAIVKLLILSHELHQQIRFAPLSRRYRRSKSTLFYTRTITYKFVNHLITKDCTWWTYMMNTPLAFTQTNTNSPHTHACVCELGWHAPFTYNTHVMLQKPFQKLYLHPGIHLWALSLELSKPHINAVHVLHWYNDPEEVADGNIVFTCLVQTVIYSIFTYTQRLCIGFPCASLLSPCPVCLLFLFVLHHTLPSLFGDYVPTFIFNVPNPLRQIVPVGELRC